MVSYSHRDVLYSPLRRTRTSELHPSRRPTPQRGQRGEGRSRLASDEALPPAIHLVSRFVSPARYSRTGYSTTDLLGSYSTSSSLSPTPTPTPSPPALVPSSAPCQQRRTTSLQQQQSKRRVHPPFLSSCIVESSSSRFLASPSTLPGALGTSCSAPLRSSTRRGGSWR
ncbi:hypothetical protein BCR35DRAFT_301933 [Leucosporidium creatinivorum]|uniref:Uncharacterized protein n=1 Tax=Leucosporidium creatinivorum TaxID=106004 RepID=A0A1Y2FWX1_9BASI|nr:hypothetical protein BCR35DRAFT_301933 [Leucosporidium creatinivorum]